MKRVIQKRSSSQLAKVDNYIRFFDLRGAEYIYVSNIDMLCAEFEKRTGDTLCWRPAPVLYFYQVWVQKKKRQIQ